VQRPSYVPRSPDGSASAESGGPVTATEQRSVLSPLSLPITQNLGRRWNPSRHTS
jgi:hypothetical protein